MPPLPRTTHATLGLDGGRVLVFGGEVWDESGKELQGLDNAIHLLDPTNHTWSRSIPERSPMPRCHIPLACDPEKGTVLLWGGAGMDDQGNFILLNDTWLLNAQTLTWMEVKNSAGEIPPPAADAAMVFDSCNDRFLLFLERGAWEFSTETSTWRRMNFPPGPAPRESITIALDPEERKVFFFGGGAGPRFFDDTWILDLKTNEWREIVTDIHPSARVRPAHALHPKEHMVVLYGGVRGQLSQRFEDLWLFDLHEESWTLVNEKDPSSPGRRGGFEGMAFDPGTEVFTLFGGRSDEAHHYNDTWQLRLSRGS